MSKNLPSYRHHKASGQAVARIDKKDVYLGVHGSPASHLKYAELISEWQSRQTETITELKIRQLTSLYLEFCKSYYVKAGKVTTEVNSIRDALKRLNFLHRDCMASRYSPKMLKAVQQKCIDDGLSRSTVNSSLARIKRMFRWAVSEELIPTTVIVGLETVRELRRGRSAAKESPPVKPVSQEHINAVLPFVSKQIGDMIRLQFLCGCRPAEIASLCPCDIDTEGDVWEYVPASHKTEHHGKERKIYFGPRSQAILGPYLENRPASEHCFSPIESEAERRSVQRKQRKTRVQPSQQNRKKPNALRKVKPFYDVAAYRRAISRGCEAAGIPSWSPNQLRHSRSTDLRKLYGIEASQTVCGHSSLNTTLLYAETHFERARAIMADIG